MDKKILIVNDTRDMGKPYHPLFDFLGDVIYDFSYLDKDPDSIKLIVFTGGSDVQPSFYKEPIGFHTYCDEDRDLQECKIFYKAKYLNIPMFGICRGSQFLCVMNGGKLIQHCTGHQRDHYIVLNNKEKFLVSSAHHQMMIPSKNDEIIGWAEPKLSDCYLDGNNKQIDYDKEVEIVKFSDSKSYGVQFHPEIMDENDKGVQYVKNILKEIT